MVGRPCVVSLTLPRQGQGGTLETFAPKIMSDGRTRKHEASVYWESPGTATSGCSMPGLSFEPCKSSAPTMLPRAARVSQVRSPGLEGVATHALGALKEQ